MSWEYFEIKTKGSVHPTLGYRFHWVNGCSMAEHRIIMQNFLGRKLDRHEHVHHKNEDKLDNRIENLEVLSDADHLKHHRPWEKTSTSKDYKGKKLWEYRIGVEPACKLKKEEVEEIYDLIDGGMTVMGVHRKTGRSRTAIYSYLKLRDK